MNSKLLTILSLILLACVFAQPAEAAAKKLKIFILAGQSNTVGHVNAHTMGALFNPDGPKDKVLADLVFGKDAKVSKQRLDETLALAKQLNELTGGIGDPKIKAMTDAAQKAAAEAEANRIKANLEAYKKDVIATSAVSDRVYINSIADNNRRSGKLAIGYGGNDAKIGGCANSTGAGARLRATGSTDARTDDLELHIENLPPRAITTLVMGSNAIRRPYGDGLLMVHNGGAAGSVLSELARFPVKTARNDGAISFGPGIAHFAAERFTERDAIQPGAVRFFQVIYRDVQGPCGTGMNATNALAVSFE